MTLELKTKVLVVDDEAMLLELFGSALTDAGYHVRLADSAEAALSEIQREIPHILLSDLNMPGISGFELLREVRRRFPDVGVVAMSGAFAGDSVPPGVHADAFHQKGLGVGRLVRTIAELVQIPLGPDCRATSDAPTTSS